MKLIITRHGETGGNVQNIFQGQGVDTVLNENGLLQAKRLGLRLREERIHVAYSSDLKRAVHTAREVLRFHSRVRLVQLQELRERNLGDYEGLPKGGGNRYEVESAVSSLSFADFKPPCGESYTELQRRASKFYYGLQENHQDQTVLVISHGGFVTMLTLYLLNLPITFENCKMYQFRNTGVAILEIFGKVVAPIVVNDVSHLNNLLDNSRENVD